MDRLSESIWHGAPFVDFGICKNGLSGPEYIITLYGKLEDNADIKPGGIWDSRHQKRNLSRRLIFTITVCDHHDVIVTDCKGHKSWPATQERRLQDQSPALYGWLVQTVWSYSEDIGMKFGIDKYAVLELERGRLLRSEGIELPDGERIKRGRSGRV